MVQFDITLTQKSCDNLVLTNLDNKGLITKILAALKEAECCLEERADMLDSEGWERVTWLTQYIRATGWHRSGDIWVATDTEVGCDVLVAEIDKWLPKLSNQLHYCHKTYPVLIHGVPISGMEDNKIMAVLVNENSRHYNASRGPEAC